MALRTPARDSLRGYDSLPDSAAVPASVVAAVSGVSVATVWRWSKSGRLPRPRHLGPNSTRWIVGELRRAMAGDAA
jgi:predicted DNA-binding transcriptional regulator AlpA